MVIIILNKFKRVIINGCENDRCCLWNPIDLISTYQGMVI